MALKIRLRQQGRTNRLFYRLIVTDGRTRRDGKYREALGWYNPEGQETEKNVSVDAERLQYWLDYGASLSEKAKSLVSRAAPDVMKKQQEKELAHRAKMAAKRKERKKKA